MGSTRESGQRDKSSPLTSADTPTDDQLTTEKSRASNWGDLCMDECLYSGHHNKKPMIRCCHCASWVHNDCIAQSEEFVDGVWPCFKCRRMPSQVLELTTAVNALSQLVQSLTDTTRDLQKQQERTVVLLKERDESLDKLTNENLQLRQRVAEVIADPNKDKRSQSPKPHGTVILGSSIIRDIDQNKLVATKCICIPGGYINDIQAAVDKFPPGEKLCRAVLVVGGNDCDSREDKVIADILAEYKDLIEGAKTIASSVTVSSICPRRKSPELTERIDALNAGLQVLCGELKVDFVDHNPSFHLQDGTFNEGFILPDNVHLTRAATIKLVSNLKLHLRQGEEHAHTDHRRRDDAVSEAPKPRSQTEASSVSDDLDLSLSFWQKATQKARRQNRGQSARHTERPNPRAPTGRRPQRPSYAQAASRAETHSNIRNRGQSQQVIPTPNQAPSQISRRPNRANIPRASPQTAPLMNIPTRAPPTHETRQTSPIDTENSKCQLCLGNGHTAVTCKSQNSQCYKCSQYGHLARACPT